MESKDSIDPASLAKNVWLLVGCRWDTDNVTEIDANGLLVLKNFYYSAIRKNKTFWITGVGCKEIYDEMKHSNVA